MLPIIAPAASCARSAAFRSAGMVARPAMTSSILARSLHTPARPSSLLQQLSRSAPSKSSSQLQSVRSTFRRSYNNGNSQASSVYSSAAFRQRLLYGAGIFGGTILATNLIFNRETREDGGMPEYERSFLNETFLHTGLGLGIIGVAARSLHASGWSVRLMATNPWLVMGVGMVASIGTAYGTLYTDPDKYVNSFPSPLSWFMWFFKLRHS